MHFGHHITHIPDKERFGHPEVRTRTGAVALWAQTKNSHFYKVASQNTLHLGNVKLPHELKRLQREVEQKGPQNSLYYFLSKPNPKPPTWQLRRSTCIHTEKSQVEQLQNAEGGRP